MSARLKAFSHRHLVCFEETNFLGNVYFAHYASWQGRCREAFLKERAPGVVEALRKDFRLVTLHLTVDYFEEALALDEIETRLRLAYSRQHRLGLSFEFWKLREGGDEHRLAAGTQEVGCYIASSRGLEPVSPPDELRAALSAYADESTYGA
jgi:enediyne biosynthesis thioesterase